MATDDLDSSQELRGKTDKNLKHERGKTDAYLNQHSKPIEKETSDTIRVHRLAADTAQDRDRADADRETSAHRDGTFTETSRLADERVIQERERSDHARTVERETEDRAWAHERLRRRLIADALLDTERGETDRSLGHERGRFDVESELQAHRLSDEHRAHDLTKAALATRDQFLAIVSHDLKNPLVAISIGARLLRRSLPKEVMDPGSVLAHLQMIEQSAASMDRMISDLLDVEHMAREHELLLRPTRVDLCALAQECVNLFAPIAGSQSVSLILSPCPAPIFADVDHDRILQVLSNIIGNALKFTPHGGTIELFVRKHETTVEISVTDNGLGIPPDKQDQIFERYAQLTSKDRRGLGMGLFISKWIVEAHRGRIWVTSDGVRGSTFSFTLPLPVSE